MPWRSFAWTVLLSFVACSDDARSCTDMGCAGYISLPLVSESGQPASARGEYRRGGTNPVVTRFNCDDDREADERPCPGGIIGLEGVAGPGPVFEIRFRRLDDSFTDWQIVDLRIEATTDPDFNGPGCPCTWYEGRPEPVVVPATAMLLSAEP